jgi:hypothetical protein
MGAPAVASPLNLANRVQLSLERVEYRRADTDVDREAIFRLRYDAYLREGAIAPNFGRTVSDRYDDSDNGWLVGVYIDGQLAGSLRVHVATKTYPDTPNRQAFEDLIDPPVADGKVVIDPTRFVADYRLAARFPELPYITTRIGHMAAEYFSADIVLAVVRPEHQAFYARVFGHRRMSDARLYPGLLKPISLMMLDYPAQRQRILSRHPIFASTRAEQAALFGSPPEIRRQPAAAGGDAQALVG